MQTPDETIEFHYARALAPAPDAWTPLAELQSQHLLAPEKLELLKRPLESVRGQVAAERELQSPPDKPPALQPGFIDLPQKLFDNYRRKGDASELGRSLKAANRLHANVDRLIVLGSGAGALAGRAVIEALGHVHHNELSRQARFKRPRVYFEGETFDNDGLQELFEMLESSCIEPDNVEERWGVVAACDATDPPETLAAYRAFRAKALSYYGGPKGEWFKQLVVPVASPRSKLREVAKADGFGEDEIFMVPDNVGGRFGAFTAATLVPAAALGVDVTALLMGAAAMTKRFLEEPFDRNPVLQYAAVHHLVGKECKVDTRLFAVWDRKLAGVARWYEQFVAESLGKLGRGPTPVGAVFPRELYGRGLQALAGPRGKMVTNVRVKTVKQPPVMIGMSDRNEDDLNAFSRRGYPDLVDAAYQAAQQAQGEGARPVAEVVLPELTPFVMGQLLQMLMLATVVEGRLANTNPYGRGGEDPFRRNFLALLRATPNLPKGEVRDAAKGM